MSAAPQTPGAAPAHRLRLDRCLCEALELTRSQARALLARGAVTVNGAVCKKADTQLAPDDTVLANGQPVRRQPFVYLMLDKPAGVVSASADGRDVTVVDLVRDAWPRRQLFPAGRLDKDSTGFVLLTDDGTFAHRILSPRRHVPKTYLVGLDCPVTSQMVAGFAAGVTLADGSRMHPAQLLALPQTPCSCQVVLTQGVYHQIKRMFGVYGAGVTSLRRLAIGGLWLDETLGPGGWRQLSAAELRLLAGDAAPAGC